MQSNGKEILHRNKSNQPDQREPVPTKFSSGLLLTTGGPILADKRLVLVQQVKNGKWGIIAGHTEVSPRQQLTETPRQTIVRELGEETGLSLLTINQLRYIGNLYISPTNGPLSLGFVYTAEIRDNSVDFVNGYIPPDIQEVSLVKGFDVDEVAELTKSDIVHKPELNIPLLRYWAFMQVYNKYEPWEGHQFAEFVAERRLGIDGSALRLFEDQDKSFI